MRHPLKAVLVTVMSMIAALFALATPAYAKTFHVHPGESIQAAVDQASPGDRVLVEPGKYRELVEIQTDGVRLEGSGASPNGTVLEPPAKGTNDCSMGDPDQNNGICVVGSFQPGGPPVKDVTVSGFLVRDFPSSGIIGFNTENLTVRHSVAVDDGYYGITSFAGTGGQFLYNTATGSLEAGFYVGDTDDADFLQLGNIAYGNTIGSFVRNASHGTVSNNTWHDNCAGMIMLAGAPGPVTGWTVKANQSYHNDMDCPGFSQSRVLQGIQDPSSVTGIGILLAGASNNLIVRNTVWANQPAQKANASGGIVLRTGGGKSQPDGNTINANVAYHNLSVDLKVDPRVTGNNTFTSNQCETSKPSGLCV
jgi:hypothetical protein